jgi:hypothetical protein
MSRSAILDAPREMALPNDSHKFQDGRVLRKLSAGLCRSCRRPKFRYVAYDGAETCPDCWRCQANAILDAATANAVAVADPRDAVERERLQLKADYPSLELGLPPLPPRSQWLFHHGLVYATRLGFWTRGQPLAVGVQVVPAPMWWGLVQRHVSGDHGLIGTTTDAHEIDDASFAPELAEPAARNAATLRVGEGLVRSRYEFPADCLNGLTPKQRRPDGSSRLVLEILTLLANNAGSRTLCSFV